ncbi:MAG: porin family protein [Proteobacteria bacterium]|nr:porin family protein [Pseudomonadota bacterium]
MKKILAFLAIVGFASTAQAGQYFVGGGVGFNWTEDTETAFNISPELGYKMSPKWDIGLGLGYSYYNDHPTSTDINSFSVAPFARYNLVQFGKFNVLLKGSVDFSYANASAGGSSISGTSFGINIAPMVTYDISESFTLYANLNFLGVGLNNYSGDLYDALGVSGTRIGLYLDSTDVFNTNNVQVGFYYNF